MVTSQQADPSTNRLCKVLTLYEEQTFDSRSIRIIMKVLCVSDIHWEDKGRDILTRLKEDIADVSPSVVLLGGDVINDGRNRREHVTEFLELLQYLEDTETPSCTIKGNHDEYSDYEKVSEDIDELTYANELSAGVAEIDDISILGIPYEYTHDLDNARNISDDFPDKYDIVLAHAELHRRIWLFEIDADYIITGHVGKRLCLVDNQLFASLDSYPEDIIKIQPEDCRLSYSRSSDPPFSGSQRYEAQVKIDNGELVWLFDDYNSGVSGLQQLDDPGYARNVERLLAAKRDGEELIANEGEEIVGELLSEGISETQIREYIGSYGVL